MSQRRREFKKKDKLIKLLKLKICKYEKERIGLRTTKKTYQAIQTEVIDNKRDLLLFRTKGKTEIS